jgi:protein-S-isoprenylcysteine O-methyltransferase Ste14
MPATALFLELLFLVTALGLRIWLHRRRTGSSGVHGASGERFSPEWWAGPLFGLGVLLGIGAPAAALAGVSRLLLGSAVLHASGTVVALAGWALTLVAQSTMGASWRVGVDPSARTALVTGGLFARVRNPIFTGMITTSLGLAMLVPTIPALLALASVVAAIELQVRFAEEPYLLRVHGSDYLAYAASAGRFVPGFGSLEPDPLPTPPTTGGPS